MAQKAGPRFFFAGAPGESGAVAALVEVVLMEIGRAGLVGWKSVDGGFSLGLLDRLVLGRRRRRGRGLGLLVLVAQEDDQRQRGEEEDGDVEEDVGVGEERRLAVNDPVDHG